MFSEGIERDHGASKSQIKLSKLVDSAYPFFLKKSNFGLDWFNLMFYMSYSLSLNWLFNLLFLAFSGKMAVILQMPAKNPFLSSRANLDSFGYHFFWSWRRFGIVNF